MILFQTVAGAVGLTLILTRSKLFTPIRESVAIFGCDQCLGFWCGLLVGSQFLSPKFCLLCALISSGCGFVIMREYPRIIRKENKKLWATSKEGSARLPI